MQHHLINCDRGCVFCCDVSLLYRSGEVGYFALSFVYNLPIFEYRPNQIKQTITGYGRADKQQVSQMVCRLLGLENIPKIDDTSDALAVALTHLTYQRQQHLGHQ